MIRRSSRRLLATVPPCLACARPRPDQPGWTRRRAGKGFVYLDEHGRKLSAAKSQRARDLVIPPAWTDVWITPYENGHLQAVGTDDAGRRQYLYHPQWRARRDAEKFDRMLLFGKALAKAREQVLLDLGLDGMPLERACAAAVRLLDLGYFRIGNDVYADENGSFGLTTLERRHVRRHQDALIFAFVGKSGVEHEITIDDAVVIDGDRDHASSPRRRRRPSCCPTRTAGRGGQPAAGPGQRLRARLDRPGVDGEGLPHLARHRAGGGRAGRDAGAGAQPRPPASGRSPAR